MALYQSRILRVVTNGPYMYAIVKNGLGQKGAISQTNVSQAFDNVKADIAADLAVTLETVQSVSMGITTTGPVASYEVRLYLLAATSLYSYVILKNGQGQKDVNGLSLSAALDGVKTDVGALLGTETIQQVNMGTISA